MVLKIQPEIHRNVVKMVLKLELVRNADVEDCSGFFFRQFPHLLQKKLKKNTTSVAHFLLDLNHDSIGYGQI